MARIRTIKPEFYSSPGINETSPWARLLYIAMWNWADDTGRGKAEARELMGFAFPLDEDMTVCEFRRLLGEVRRVFGVNFYKVDGRPYYSIPSWEKHQKIDKRSQSRWPAPEEGEAYDPDTNMPSELQEQSNSWVLGGHSADTRRTSGAGTEEQGNSGTEEQETLCPPPAGDKFDEFWATYPKRKDKGHARVAYGKALAKVDATTIIEGAERYRDDPTRVDRYTKNAGTWLNGECWADEVTPSSKPVPAGERLWEE